MVRAAFPSTDGQMDISRLLALLPEPTEDLSGLFKALFVLFVSQSDKWCLSDQLSAILSCCSERSVFPTWLQPPSGARGCSAKQMG